MFLAKKLAVRAARWSLAHRRRAILGWLTFAVLALGVGGAVGTQQLGRTEKGAGESARAEQTLDDAGSASSAHERVLVRAAGLTAEDPLVRAAAADVAARLQQVPEVGDVREPRVARNGRALLVEFFIAGSLEESPEKMDPVLAAVDEARRANPAVELLQTGDASAAGAVGDRLVHAVLVSGFTVMAAAGGMLVALLGEWNRWLPGRGRRQRTGARALASARTAGATAGSGSRP